MDEVKKKLIYTFVESWREIVWIFIEKGERNTLSKGTCKNSQQRFISKTEKISALLCWWHFFRWIRKVRLVQIIIVIISFFKPWKSTRGFLPLFMFFFCFSFDVIKSERLSWIPLNICFRFKNKIFKPQLLLRREFIDFMLLYLNSLYEVNERWCLRCIRVHYANGSELQFLFLQKHLVVLL